MVFDSPWVDGFLEDAASLGGFPARTSHHLALDYLVLCSWRGPLYLADYLGVILLCGWQIMDTEGLW